MSKRFPELSSPFSKARKTIVSFLSRPFEKFTRAQIFWAGFALLCIITTFLINNPFWRSGAEAYREGDIARESIISPADITQTDAEETEKLKQSAREGVRPIFTSESNRAEQAVQSFRSAWENLARKTDASNSNAKARRTMDGRGRRGIGESFCSAKIYGKRARSHHPHFA